MQGQADNDTFEAEEGELDNLVGGGGTDGGTGTSGSTPLAASRNAVHTLPRRAAYARWTGCRPDMIEGERAGAGGGLRDLDSSSG